MFGRGTGDVGKGASANSDIQHKVVRQTVCFSTRHSPNTRGRSGPYHSMPLAGAATTLAGACKYKKGQGKEGSFS